MTKNEVLEEYDVEECEKWTYKGRGQLLRGVKQEVKIDGWRSADRWPRMATLLAEMLWVIKKGGECVNVPKKNGEIKNMALPMGLQGVGRCAKQLYCQVTLDASTQVLSVT